MLELYRTTDPLTTALWGAGAFALLCWVLSLITKEYSWVDRLWSITPPLFAVHFAAYASFDDPRLNLMAVLTLIWGARLTYNFARKGGYAPGGEDYRWKEIMEKIGPAWFQLLNATFLAPLQNFLLLAIVLPSYAAYQHAGTPLNALDALAAAGFILFFLGETVAQDLTKNGLELEAVSLTGLDQTDMQFFNPSNAFDAEGLTRLTEEIERRKKSRNDIEQDTLIQIRTKNLETEKQSLEIERSIENAWGLVAAEQAHATIDFERADIGPERLRAGETGPAGYSGRAALSTERRALRGASGGSRAARPRPPGSRPGRASARGSPRRPPGRPRPPRRDRS